MTDRALEVLLVAYVIPAHISLVGGYIYNRNKFKGDKDSSVYITAILPFANWLFVIFLLCWIADHLKRNYSITRRK